MVKQQSTYTPSVTHEGLGTDILPDRNLAPKLISRRLGNLFGRTGDSGLDRAGGFVNSVLGMTLENLSHWLNWRGHSSCLSGLSANGAELGRNNSWCSSVKEGFDRALGSLMAVAKPRGKHGDDGRL